MISAQNKGRDNPRATAEADGAPRDRGPNRFSREFRPTSCGFGRLVRILIHDDIIPTTEPIARLAQSWYDGGELGGGRLARRNL